MKYKIFTVTALTGGALAELFGGWDKALQMLVILMVVDYRRDFSAGGIWKKSKITKWCIRE